MKVMTQDKLNRYQYEYNNLLEQNQMLSANLEALINQRNQMQQYAQANPGAVAYADVNKITQRCNSLQNTIRKNSLRMQTLWNQITAESRKLQQQQMKMMQQMYKSGGRGQRMY